MFLKTCGILEAHDISILTGVYFAVHVSFTGLKQLVINTSLYIKLSGGAGNIIYILP